MESMIPLEEIPLAGFSLGSLLVPKGFTVDVHRSHVGLSFPANTRGRYYEEHSDANSNTLFPPGTTFNTVRLEEYEEDGALLYVTELFVPHHSQTGHRWDAAAVEEMVQRSQRQGDGTEVWVTPVPFQPRPKTTENDAQRASLSSILGATNSVFIVIIAVCRSGADTEAISQVAEELQRWVVAQYQRPLSELTAYHHFFQTAEDQEEEGEDVKENKDHTASAFSLPCSPLTLSADLPSVGAVAVRSKRCGGLLLPPCVPRTFDSMQWGGDPQTLPSVVDTFQAVIQDLGLLSEDLFFSSTLPCGTSNNNHQSSSEQIHALCTFPLDLTSSSGVASVFNYLSIEASFELQAQAQHRWRVCRLESSKRYAPSAEVVEALREACQEETARRLSAHPSSPGGALAAFRRQHPIPQRHTTYQIEAKEGDSCRHTLLAQLYNPLCASDHAVVVLTMEHATKEEHTDSNTPPQQLPNPFSLQIGSTAEWTSLATQDAGFLFRQGQLVLRVPAGDARYRGTRVVPTSSQLFTSLGSLTTEVSPRLPSTGSPPPPQQMYDSMSVTWTVVSNGSSADDYVEDIIAEYMYDTGNYKKPPFGSTHPYFFSVMEKQRLQAGKPISTAAAKRLAGPASGATSYAWLSAGHRQCLYVLVRESGIGQLLLVEASVDVSCRPQRKEIKEKEEAEGEQSVLDKAERNALAEWVEGIAAVVIPRFS